MRTNQHLENAEANGPIDRAFRDRVTDECVFSSLQMLFSVLKSIDPVRQGSRFTVKYNYESDSCSNKAYMGEPRFLVGSG